MTTESGESMLRVKALAISGAVSSERQWRRTRTDNLATIIAWHRLTRSPLARRIIVEDIIPDIGWPRWSVLFPLVRARIVEIRRNLRKPADE